MMKKLSPLQAAYLRGYKRAMNKAREELRQTARNFDEQLGELQSDYEFMIKEMRREQKRYADIDAALRAKPGDDDIWLN